MTCVNVLPQYKASLGKHLSRRIFEHDKFQEFSEKLQTSPLITEGGEFFYICVDFLWDETLTLKEMYTLEDLVEKELGCGNFELYQIRMGSLVFHYRIPSSESLNLELLQSILRINMIVVRTVLSTKLLSFAVLCFCYTF